MSRTFNLIPTPGGFAHLVCRPAVSRETWPLVQTKVRLLPRHGMVPVPAVEIRAISFDRHHWWRWPWETPPGERAGDDPGALATAEAARQILDRYLLGEVSADLCVRSFGDLGLELALEPDPDPEPDVTDDAGPERAGRWDATDDHGAEEAGSTDDPGEAAPNGDG